jgi:hypothetical protein
MEPEQKHISPDGKLILVVYRDGDDCTIGFQGSEWHTHADVLVPKFGSTEPKAVEGLVRSILTDQLVIGICPIKGMNDQVWVETNPEEDVEQRKRYMPDLCLRYWSGMPYSRLSTADSTSGKNNEKEARTKLPQEQLDRIGVTRDEAIVVCMCYYQLPLAREKFGEFTCGEWGLPRDKAETISTAIDSCMTKGWIKSVPTGTVVPATDENNNPTSDQMLYPEGGFVLTEAGWTLWQQFPPYL